MHFVRPLAPLLAIGLVACSAKSPPPAPSPAPVASTTAVPVATTDAGGCTTVWTEADAVLRSRSMYEEISFDRAQRTITEKVHSWKGPKSVRLSDSEYRELDGALAALCLTTADEPPPPPGGPMDVKIESNHAATRRLGVRGNTGGTFFVLSGDRAKTMFDTLKKYSPEHRDCLPLDKDGAVITGDLLDIKGDDGDHHPSVLLPFSVCVGAPPGVMAGSVELVTGHQQSVVAPANTKHVTVTGKLSTKPNGDRTDVFMFVTSLKEQ